MSPKRNNKLNDKLSDKRHVLRKLYHSVGENEEVKHLKKLILD